MRFRRRSHSRRLAPLLPFCLVVWLIFRNQQGPNLALPDQSWEARGTKETTHQWRPSKEWIQNCVEGETSQEIKPFNTIWRRYVLGDCIKLCRNCYYLKCVRHPEKTLQQGTGCFEKTSRNDTFAALYHFRACKTNFHVEGGNWTIMDQILQETTDRKDPNFAVPTTDTLVIHLRLGDVIENSNASVAQMLEYGADPWHVPIFQSAIKSVDEYLSNIESSGLSKIEIRGGSHDPNYYYKSRIYAGCLHRAIQEAGYEVNMQLEGVDPDRDFFYTSHAKHLIVSTGGYSGFIGTLAKRNGGRIIGREFYNPP